MNKFNYDDIDNDFASRHDMMQRLEFDTCVFKNHRIKEAFEHVDRKDFVPDDYIVEAYEDYALPLTTNSSITQPTTLAFMLELLDPQEGEIILEVGSGSGFTTALLAYLVGEKGRVIGLEKNQDLVRLGKDNTSSCDQVEVIQSHASLASLPSALDAITFDRILVSVGVDEIPSSLRNHLKEDGVLVIPLQKDKEHTLTCLRKKGEELLVEKSFSGFMFNTLE